MVRPWACKGHTGAHSFMPSILAEINMGTQRHKVVGCIAWLDLRRGFIDDMQMRGIFIVLELLEPVKVACK